MFVGTCNLNRADC